MTTPCSFISFANIDTVLSKITGTYTGTCVRTYSNISHYPRRTFFKVENTGNNLSSEVSCSYALGIVT
jgi:hypothetical protein